MLLANLFTDIQADGFFSVMLRPFSVAFGGLAVFWLAITFITIGLVYQVSNDVYYPLVLLIISGALFSSAVTAATLGIGWGMVVLAIGGMFMRVIAGRFNR